MEIFGDGIGGVSCRGAQYASTRMHATATQIKSFNWRAILAYERIGTEILDLIEGGSAQEVKPGTEPAST